MARRWLGLTAVVCMAFAVIAEGVPHAAGAGFVNWPAYLYGPGHASFNGGAATITPANASNLTRTRIWQPPAIAGRPPAILQASPTVFNGRIYIGSNTGRFYSMNEDGTNVKSVDLDLNASWQDCPETPGGIISTAAIATDPATGTPTVYVAGAHSLYALDPGSLAIEHQVLVGNLTLAAQGDYYNWSSPTVAQGKIYMGISAALKKDASGECEPATRGGVEVFDQSTLKPLAKYWTVPNIPAGAAQGGDVWASIASGAGGVFVPTGSDDEDLTGSPDNTPDRDSNSIVRLDRSTLTRGPNDIFTPPGLSDLDLDFGSSPTPYTAVVGGVSTKLVASCNKDGILYSLPQADLAAGPGTTLGGWARRVAKSPINPDGTRVGGNDHCQTSAITGFPGTLIFAANRTTIGGVNYPGSIRSLNSATGAINWRHGLTCMVLGSPSADAAGVIAVATWGKCRSGSTNAVYLYNVNGTRLATLSTNGSRTFPQPVFADDSLFVATESAGLFRFRP
jgi:hypothetical protein